MDIAGLVRGASKGEGLGNKFLENIRQVAVIAHVVRCFDDPNVIHVDESVDPLRDLDTIRTELILADLQTVEKRLANLAKKKKCVACGIAHAHGCQWSQWTDSRASVDPRTRPSRTCWRCCRSCSRDWKTGF